MKSYISKLDSTGIIYRETGKTSTENTGFNDFETFVEVELIYPKSFGKMPKELKDYPQSYLNDPKCFKTY